MSRRDSLHPPVRRALEKDGWIITDDPLILPFKDRLLKTDLGAERALAAEKAGRKIAVEIKDFDHQSPVNELEKTLGQLQLYEWALEEIEPDRELFLAISEEVYNIHFTTPLFRTAVERAAIKIVIVNREKEEILKWET